MKYNKQRLCNEIRRYYPSAFGIRHSLQRWKVQRLHRYQLDESLVNLCEKNPERIREIVVPEIQKNKKRLTPIIQEMEDILENGPLFKNRKDKDKLRNDIIFCRLAYGFLPSEYVCFELENKTPEQRREYVSDLDMNVFGYSVNDISAIQTILDKGDSYHIFQKYFRRDAVVIDKKNDYDAFCNFVNKHSVFVKKRTISSMGKGVELVDLRTESDLRSYFLKLIKDGKYLLEEKVEQDEPMAVFHASSVNTVRCFTMKIDEKIVIPWTFMRTGRNGAFVDNGGSGGLLAGVDPATGCIITDGYDEYNDCFYVHPESHIQFKGYQIPEWDNLIKLCTEMASIAKGMGYLSFDLALMQGEWIVIEVNEIGQFIGPQMTMKNGIKKELLSYYNQMEKFV